MNLSTGEIFDEPGLRYGGKHFWKLYMKPFVRVLRAFNNKQLDVFAYILEQTQQSTNTFRGTYRSISKACDVSLATVTQVMKLLQDSGFIVKLQNGTYIISPDVLLKGDEKKKGMILKEYRSAKKETAVSKDKTAADSDALPEDHMEKPKEGQE